MHKGFASNYRIVLLAIAVFGGFAAIGTRLVDLHVIDREALIRHVDRVRETFVVQPARRGDILDARGDVLATSRTLIVLGIDPQVVRPEDQAKFPELARLLGLPLAEVVAAAERRTREVRTDPGDPDSPLVERPVQYVKLSDTVEESTFDQIRALGIRAVTGTREYARIYPNNALASHLIGYINKENVAAAGLEAFADFYLRGQDGWLESEKDGRRRELPQFRTRDVAPTDGFSVVLSIDSFIQQMVEEELASIAEAYRPAKATIIVSDAKSGFILGLGNYPTFNLNTFNVAPLEVQRNVAVTDQLDPGSTFKIVAVAGAIEEGLVSPQTRLDCSSETIVYQGRTLRFMREDHPKAEPLSVREIIAKSSNRGTTQLAMKLGDRKFYEYARAFGFGEQSGFPFGGEISGMLHSPDKWSGIDITRIPSGYSISATPLQIHYSMGVIASGGELMRPQLIREIRDRRGETVYTFGGVARRRVIGPRTAESMARMLQAVVSAEGTAGKIALPGYQLAGKTGTARKLVDGRYSDKNHVASFSGFFPASQPRVVISVVVDDARLPDGADAYGSRVAAPSFQNIARKLISYLDIKPVEDTAMPRAYAALEGGRR